MDGTETRATDTITFGQTFATVKVYDVETGTTPIATLSNVSSYTLTTMNPCDMYLLVLTPAAVTDLIPDGTYIIGNRSNGNIASMATANIGAGIMQGSASSLDTTWTVTNLGSNVVKITNVGVGGVIGCVSVAINGGLVAQTATGVTSQQWTVTQPAPGWFTLTAKPARSWLISTAALAHNSFWKLPTAAQLSSGLHAGEPDPRRHIHHRQPQQRQHRQHGHRQCWRWHYSGPARQPGHDLDRDQPRQQRGEDHECRRGRRDRLRLRSHQRRPGRPDRYRRDLAAVDRHSACPRWFTLTSKAGPFVADIYSCLGTQLLLETANGGSTQQWSFH